MSDRKDRIVILGGRPNLVTAARDLGLDVIWIAERDTLPAGLDGQVRLVRAPLADYPALERLVLDLHAERPIRRVFSLTEFGMLATGKLNERLGLGGNSVATIRTLLDKSVMRETMAATGLPRVRHRLVRDLGQTLDFLDEIGGPIILKPPADAGSRHVFEVPDRAAAARAWRTLSDEQVPALLAEELLTGHEISVESFSVDGRHLPIAFTDKVFAGPDSLVEVGHTMPAGLDPAARDRATRAVESFLDAMGLRDGPAHTELMLTRDGPRIIESHTRVGGGGITEVVARAYGVDLPHLTVAVPLGRAVPPDPLPAPIGGAASRAILPPPGRVVEVSVPTRLPDWARVSVECSVGDLIRPLRSSHDKKAGLVVAAGPDAAAAAARCERLLGSIRVVTAPPGSRHQRDEHRPTASARSRKGREEHRAG